MDTSPWEVACKCARPAVWMHISAGAKLSSTWTGGGHLGGVLGDFPASAGPLPHWGNSLRNVHYSSGLIWAVGGLWLTLCSRSCVCFSTDTLQRKWVSLQRDKNDRDWGGCWAGFHLALFMSQDKASRVREKLRAKRGGSSLVWLMYDKCS